MEEWKEIPGYEGLYEASNAGKVRSVDGKVTSNARYAKRVWRSREIKQKFHGTHGRKDARVELWKNGAHNTRLVSRLVASAWIGPPAPNMTVNHINGDPCDNRAENLEWVSLPENIRKGFETGLYSNLQKPVSIMAGGESLTFPSLSEASRFLGRSHSYMSDCIKKRRTPVSSDGIRFEVAT